MHHCRTVFPVLLAMFLGAHLPTVVVAQSKAIQRIAFGSCADEKRPQPIWEAIVASHPDLFLFIGDNIYGDSQDMKELREKYAKLGAMKGYQKLRKACPLWAVWDDHDYGKNDAGTEFPLKKESQKVFLDFFEEPKSSPRWQREGLYDAKMFGPADQRVQVILLDTRYFRTALKRRDRFVRGLGPYVPNPDPQGSILGEAQWKWLEKQLKEPAKVRLIVSSIQVVPEDHGWEKWMNIPHERDRLFKLIRDTEAAGVIFVSGDRHLAEISMMDGGVGYPLYDITSSGLNFANKEWREQEVNRHRVATMNFGDNFGVIGFDWDAKDPVVRLQIRDVVGDIILQQKVPLSVLQPGTLKLGASPSRVKLADGTLLTKSVIEKNLKKEITLEMRVLSSGQSSTGAMVFLNSQADRNDPDNFTVVLTTKGQASLKTAGIDEPRKHFASRVIRVTGTLSQFRGTPQIMVSDAKQIELVK